MDTTEPLGSLTSQGTSTSTNLSFDKAQIHGPLASAQSRTIVPCVILELLHRLFAEASRVNTCDIVTLQTITPTDTQISTQCLRQNLRKTEALNCLIQQGQPHINQEHTDDFSNMCESLCTLLSSSRRLESDTNISRPHPRPRHN